MVLQKKGGAAAKNASAKKKGKPVFKQQVEKDDDLDILDMEDMDDDDFGDSESDEEMPVQKTPQNKTPKGKQSLSEKKVSFQIPGKNTPAKTPNKNSSLLAKKQPTPGKAKTAVQEFKGMKGKKNQAKQDDDEDDDDDDVDNDDDDEDDDDLDLDLDDDDDDEDDDLDLDLDDDGDEVDDDDDEDEVDDDDEDEESAAKGNIQKRLALLKQNNKGQTNQKTPTKPADKSEKVKTPKGNAQNNKEKSPEKRTTQMPIELGRRRERDAKMLYIGNLPKDVIATELKTLSSDIVDVVIPFLNRPHQGKSMFGFLVFESEKKAEVNYETLKSKKFRGQLINLDFVGEKSKNKRPDADQEQKHYNLKKIHVSGIPKDTTLAKVAEFFPQAYQISFNNSSDFKIAFVNFATEKDASEAVKSKKDIEIDGQKLVVLYAVDRKGNKKHNRKRSFGGKQGGSPNKRMRKNPKAE